MEGYIGEIRLFAGNFAPRSWAICDGQVLAISSNQALFSIIGTSYGGDGRSTFALPDLRGRVAVGEGQGPGLSAINLGQKGGVNSVTLTTPQIPSHTHPASGTPQLQLNLKTNSQNGSTSSPEGNYLAKSVYPKSRTETDDVNIYASSHDDTNLNGGSVTGSVDVQVGNAGGNSPHTNMQPFTGLNFIICLEGIYPSRN